ncbi:DUF1826 domain-containing protein [Methylophilus sp. 3sh_L]|uniref:DUF1826 domain-containing protein n=1 Tax=Methylophilus sp. 3sh_L TaxID=3377114 RepID=UPI00398EC605
MLTSTSTANKINRPALAHAMPPASPRLSFDPMQMLTIFEPAQQLCRIPRAPQTEISDYLQQVALKIAPGLRNVVSLTQPLAPQLEGLLPAQLGREAFIQEVEQLVMVFAELLDCQTVGLRLEVLQKAMCPQFHVDHTGIRLLCTYLGPGTEWLEEAFADRRYLNNRSADNSHQRAGVVIDTRGIRQADSFDIVLLKGSRWQNNTTGGAIHRSPAVPDGQVRVVLALDAMSN